MTLFLSVAAEATLVAVNIAVLFLLSLALRNPFGFRWLNRDEVATASALIFTAALTLSFSTLIAEFIAADLGFGAAAALGLGWLLFAAIGLWLMMDMSARLRNCDQGRSPFDQRDRPPEAGMGHGTPDAA